MNITDHAAIVANLSGHPFKLLDTVMIFRIFNDGTYDVCKGGDCWRVTQAELKPLINIPMQQMTTAVIDTARRLLRAQNEVTTLEIKAEVIKTHSSYFWTQAYVSAVMDDAHKAGMFTYRETTTGGNSHRIYSVPTIKATKPKKQTTMKTTTANKPVVKAPDTKTISKTKALELMENNRGHFFTATFVSKKGTRTINCQYLKDQTYSRLGYVKVKEAIKAKMDPADAIRQINMQTLTELKIAGNSYKVK